MTRAIRTALTIAVSVVLTAGHGRAEGSASPAPAETSPATAEASPATGAQFVAGIPPHSIRWRPWALFDPFLGLRDWHLQGGLERETPVGGGAGSGHDGFSVGFGQAIETQRRVLLVRGEQDWELRATGGGHLVFSLLRYGGVGGLLLGPVELFGGGAVALAQIHAGLGGFGIGFFSPRAQVGAAVRVGKLRVGLRAYGEYSWRWTDGPSDFVRGVVLDLARVSTPGLPEKYRLEK